MYIQWLHLHLFFYYSFTLCLKKALISSILLVSIGHNCIKKAKFDSVSLFDYLPCVLPYS